MVKFDGGRGCIICNKCRVVIRTNIFMAMAEKDIERYSKKRCYCGECIQNRIKNCEERKYGKKTNNI